MATTVVTPDGRPAQPYQTWANQSAVPTPAGTAVVNLASCPGAPEWAGGCAPAAQRAIYLAPGAMTKRLFLDMLGHIYAAAAITVPLHRAFQTLSRKQGPWASTAANDPPDEQF